MNTRSRVAFFAVTLLSTISSSPLLASTETGIASIYSGEDTANGEYAHAHALTAAHRSLPFGTKVKVTNIGNGQSVRTLVRHFSHSRRARKDETEGAFLGANRPGPALAALATGQLAGL